MSAADALVDRLPLTTLVVGKGGVGKTTCAAALALRAGARVGPTLVLSTDPARALPTVLDHAIDATPTRIDYGRNVEARLLDANALRSRFMERWGTVLRLILDRGTYLDATDIDPMVDTAFPGSDEIFSALALAELLAADESPYARIIVDTAPTGHTLRLLGLPRTFRALVRLLDAMQAKHRFMVRTLTRSYRADEADSFLAEMGALVAALESSLADPSRCAALVVTNPQPLVLEETRRYVTALAELRVQLAGVIWNAADGEPAALAVDAMHYLVPKLDAWPIGRKGLERWASELREARPTKTVRAPRRAASKPTRAARARRSTPSAAELLRALTIVAGKGGVGKTTVASALALHAAPRQRTLIVSTDPAPSLADAFAQSIPDADTPVGGVRNLFARQMDASAAFEKLRQEYADRVDKLFDALVSRGVDLSADHSIARDLLSLAPPGVDEVYGLSLIADALFEDAYACVVVDPAPTGHLLRLLEMPQLALAWSHQLLRLMLKYKDVTGLGETAQEILEFSRSLRSVDALLRDPARCGVVLVTLDEPVVRDETERLASQVRDRGVSVSGVVLNRAATSATLPVLDAPVHFQAPAVDPAPVGVEMLRRWSDSWTKGRTRDPDE